MFRSVKVCFCYKIENVVVNGEIAQTTISLFPTMITKVVCRIMHQNCAF